MITHIARFLLTDQAEGKMVFKVAQVGSMPLSVPSWIAVEVTEVGLRVSWRWLPGEDEEEMLFKRSALVGPSFFALLMRLRATKPWRTNADA